VNFNDTKVGPRRASPLLLRDEFKAALDTIGHPSLRSMSLSAAFSLTGGILRNMVAPNTKIKVPDILPSMPVAPLLSLLTTHNQEALKRSGGDFDPFDQASLALSDVLLELSDVEFGKSDVLRWADEGYVGLDEKEQLTFLYPQHFLQLSTAAGALSFTQQVAILFPESRTLAEIFEDYYAEGMRDRDPEVKIGQSLQVENCFLSFVPYVFLTFDRHPACVTARATCPCLAVHRFDQDDCSLDQVQRQDRVQDFAGPLWLRYMHETDDESWSHSFAFVFDCFMCVRFDHVDL
jgi:hypothetical protein